MVVRVQRPGLRVVSGVVTLVALVPLVLSVLLPSGDAGGQVFVRKGHHGARASVGRDRPSPGPATASPALSGSDPPYPVQTSSLRLFDPSRMTPARDPVPAAPGRLLVTDLYVPVGASGPRPLVVFAHGWNSDPGAYAPLLEGWAAAGFVVAAPVFPDSTDLAAGSPVSNYADQALDISFVITSLLRDKTVAVDPTRIAVAGHSDGGTDVALLALDPAYADPRVRTYVCMAGEMPSGVAAYTVGTTHASLLVAVGSDDEYGLYPLAAQVFQAAEPAAKAMLVEPGGDHLGSFVDATPPAAAMRDAVTQFLELALEPRAPTSAAVAGALGPPAAQWLQVVPSS
jgi:pimeloyl-ACP methyl ester carboxylesterase